MSRPSVMIDTCVLFARIPRGLTLGAAEHGLIKPHWSARILEEWRRSTVKQGGDGLEVENLVSRMNERWPDALLPSNPALEDLISLPDPGDAHVVAAAAGKVATVLTFNIRDFPTRALAGQGLEARHPDEFLWLLQSERPEIFSDLAARIATEHGAESPRAIRNLLKRSLLPRLGKAIEAALNR
ncbi:MAG: PIN domain-containing protein [Pseudomonadota bacterium]